MVDCMPMLTPMITNLKKLNTSESELVDPTLYRQLIGSLMCLVNTRPDICFVVNTLSQFMVELRRVEIFQKWWTAVTRLYSLRLGWECSGQEKHLMVLLQLRISSDFMV